MQLESKKIGMGKQGFTRISVLSLTQQWFHTRYGPFARRSNHWE